MLELSSGTTWRGTTHAFIIHFQEQFRIFDSLVSSPDRLTAAMRRTLLQNAVAPVPALAIIKTQVAQLKTQTGQDITYEDYSDLLKSAALQHDKITTPGTGRSTRHNVYQSLTHTSAGEDFASTGSKRLPSSGMGDGLIDMAAGRTSSTRGSDLVML